MKPSLRTLSFNFSTWGCIFTLLAIGAAYDGHAYLAVILALAAGSRLKFEKEYHIEKDAYLRLLARMVSTTGPRDARFREIALMTASRLEQIARKSQLLPDETLANLTNKVLNVQLELEDIITKEGL